MKYVDMARVPGVAGSQWRSQHFVSAWEGWGERGEEMGGSELTYTVLQCNIENNKRKESPMNTVVERGRGKQTRENVQSPGEETFSVNI